MMADSQSYSLEPAVQARADAEGVPVDEILARGPLFLSALTEGREYTGN